MEYYIKAPMLLGRDSGYIKAEIGWKSCDESLPVEGVKVLAVYDNSSVFLAVRNRTGWSYNGCSITVTHWSYIPILPNNISVEPEPKYKDSSIDKALADIDRRLTEMENK